MNKNLIAITIFSLLIAVGGYKLYALSNTTRVVVSPAYSSEVKDPKWFISVSDLIVTGKIVEEKKPAIGKDLLHNSDIVYTDYAFQVDKVLYNNTGKKVKTDEIIVIRTLGVATENLSTVTAGTGILNLNSNMLVGLSDTKKSIYVPSGDETTYLLSGDFHGAYVITDDSTLTRAVTKEKFDLVDIMSQIKSKNK